MSPNVRFVLEILAGLIAAYLIYICALFAMRADKMIIDELYDLDMKREIQVINGSVSPSDSTLRWNTVIPFTSNYLAIRPSVNIKGGAQFSYGFWLFCEDLERSELRDKALIIKGINESLTYKETENVIDVKTNVSSAVRTSILNSRAIMCPMISFGTSGKEFVVSFNTHHKLIETLTVSSIEKADSLFRNNLTSLTSKTWFKITIVFEDNTPINEFEEGILVKFYIGESLYASGRYASTLKQNRGDLYIFPKRKETNDSDIPGVKLSDVRYYNYALSDTDVAELSKKEPNLSPASQLASSTYIPLDINYKNYLDEYNL